MITTLQTFEHGKIDYDDTVPCIVLVQVGFMDLHEFRSFLNDALKLLIEKKKAHGKIFWLVDVRETDVVAPEDTIWVATDWTPRAMSEGLMHIAFVRPKNEVADMSIAIFQETTQKLVGEEKKMTIANFHDIEEAKEWFRKITV